MTNATSAPVPSLEVLGERLPLLTGRLRDLGVRGVQCGGGVSLFDGWLNLDLLTLRGPDGATTRPGVVVRVGEALYLQHDLTARLPMADGCIDRVYSEHFIEHIPPAAAAAWLAEVRRILRPGGLARITTPDLRRYVRGYFDRTDRFFERHRAGLEELGFKDVPARPAWMMNQIFRFWGHQWIYDMDELRVAAGAAGFRPTAVVERGYREGDPDLAPLDREVRRDESLYAEIVKA